MELELNIRREFDAKFPTRLQYGGHLGGNMRSLPHNAADDLKILKLAARATGYRWPNIRIIPLLDGNDWPSCILSEPSPRIFIVCNQSDV